MNNECGLSSKFLKRLRKMAKKDKIVLPSDNEIQESLKGYIEDGNICGHNIKYEYYWTMNKRLLEAQCLIYRNMISIYIGWAYRLLTRSDSETRNAFNITLGHELTHADGFTPLNVFHIRDLLKIRSWKFKFHTCEVYCDFGAAEKMAGCSKDKLIKSMNYKLRDKISRNKEDKSGIDHPSWAKRIKYTDDKRFDEALIRKIAKDTGCKNERLIQDVCDFYKGKEIQLT